MTTVSTGTDADRERSSLRSALLSHARPIDLAAVAAVPVILVLVFTLPETTRRSMAFTYTDPTVSTAFTAHYVHLHVDHLAANLAGYGLLAGAGYLLAAASGHRRLFFTAFVTFCLAFPFALSGLNLAVPRNAVGFGFSGINMAFAGLLPLLLAASAREQVPAAAERAHSTPPLSDSVAVRLLPPVFVVSVGWMASLALPIALDLRGVVGPAAGLFGLLWLTWTVSTLFPAGSRSAIGWGRRLLGRPGHGELLVLGVMLVVTYPIVGFPTEAAADGTVINIYVHLLGFCLAFIGTYVLVAAGAFDEPAGDSEHSPRRRGEAPSP